MSFAGEAPQNQIPSAVSQSDSDMIVEFRSVEKRFGPQRVLAGLDLAVPRGKITFVIGQSGEGKSVTLKHIVGILRPDSGRVLLDGVDMTHADPTTWIAARKKVGFLFQDGALFDSLSVFENVVFPLREFSAMNEEELHREAETLLELVGLPGRQEATPAELSIGEKKRVGLARALALRPKLLLYDEPTTSMDPLISELIDTLIVSTQRRIPGLSSVVVSHDVTSILSVADHIILLVKGKTYCQGTPDEFRSSSDPLVRQFLAGDRTGPLSKV
jgi:phospholipid/cholesterol/gamma-HCH transport system ATP-binding protein